MNRIGQNPWLGLNAYSEGSILYGRDDDTIKLTQLVLYNSDAVLYGKSGVGKSSLLNAGLLPMIRRKGFQPLSIRLDHRLEALPYALQIRNAIENAGVTIRNIATSTAQIPLLWELFHGNLFFKEDQRVPLLIIFDQFEEIFTLQHNTRLRQEFFNEMADLVNEVRPRAVSSEGNLPEPTTEENEIRNLDDSIDLDFTVPEECRTEYVDDNDIHLLFSLREDFLSEFEYYTQVIPSLKQHRYALRPIDDREAREIITIPGKEVLPEDNQERAELIAAIIEFSKDGDMKQINTLILSLTCYLLYQKSQKRAAGKLSMEDFRQIGSNLLLDFYDSLKLQPKARQVLEERLIDSNGRRNTINIEEMQDILPSWRELTDGEKRILQINSNNRVELVHDLLAQAIFETRQRRQKKSKSRILKFYLMAAVVLVFFTGLLGSVFTWSNESSDNSLLSKIPLNPDKVLELPEGDYSWLDRISKPYVETIIADGGRSLVISECYNLKRIEVRGNVTNRISIERCPQLQFIEFSDNIKVELLNLEECPNLKWLYLPQQISRINSDHDLTLIPSFENDCYKFEDGILWNLEEPRIIYMNEARLASMGSDMKVDFPFEIYDRDSIEYKYGGWLNEEKWIYNEKLCRIDSQGCYVLKANPKKIRGYYKIGKELDLSGKQIDREYAFKNCKTLEKIIIDSNTQLKDYIFSECTNLKAVEIVQDNSVKMVDIENLLICLRGLKQPIAFTISGTGPLRKTDDGVVFFNDSPVLISAESPKIYELKTQGDTTYLVTRGWFSHQKGKISLGGQPRLSDLYQIPEDVLTRHHIILKSHGALDCRWGYYLEDSYVNGILDGKNIFCRNLTPRPRTWYVSSSKISFVDLDDFVKKEITLIVPYGKLNDFLYGYKSSSYSGFKDIKEASLSLTIWKELQRTVDGALYFLRATPAATLLLVFGVIVVLLLFWYLNIHKISQDRNSEHAILRGFVEALAMVALAFLSWIATYWFCWYWMFASVDNQIHSITLCSVAGVVVAVLVLFLMYKNVLYQLKYMRFRQVKADIKTYLRQHDHSIRLAVMVLFVICVGGTVTVRSVIRHKARITRANEFLALVNEDLESGSVSRKKAALYALNRYLEADQAPTRSMADSMYSLLQSTASSMGYLSYPCNKEKFGYLSLNPSGNLLAARSGDIIKILDAKNLEPRSKNRMDQERWYPDEIDWINDTAYIASFEHSLYCYSVNDSLPLFGKRRLAGYHRQTIVLGDTVYRINYRGNLLAIPMHGQEFMNVDTIRLHDDDINCICSYKGNILTGSDDGVLRMYNPATKKEEVLFQTQPEDEIWGLTVGAYDTMIAFNTSDSIYLMKIKAGKRTISSWPKTEMDDICCIAPDGDWLIIRKDRDVYTIDSNLDPKSKIHVASSRSYYDIILGADGQTLYFIDDSKHLRMTKIENSTRLRALRRKELLKVVSTNFQADEFEMSDEAAAKYKFYIQMPE